MSKFLLLVFLLQVSGLFAHPRIRRTAPETKQNDAPRRLNLEGSGHFMIKEAWSQDPEDLILEIYNKWQANQRPGNFTLIGWQTILNDDGAPDEVRTVELGFQGNYANSTDVTAEFSNLSDDELNVMINDVIHHFHDMKASTGLDIVRSSQFFSYDEYLKFGFYLDSRDAYFPISTEVPELSYLIRNLTVKSLDDVKQFMEDNEGSIPSSLLVYDDMETEKINLLESVIVPEQMVWLTDKENVTLSMIEDAAKYISTAYAVDRENAGEYIVSNITAAYPEYKWFLTEYLNEYYVTRDVLMMFSYSSGVLATDEVTVQLFGVKK